MSRHKKHHGTGKRTQPPSGPGLEAWRIRIESLIASGKSRDAVEAAKHLGETATVTDKVDGVAQSARGHIFLNMGGKCPNYAFTAFIPAASAGLFSRPQQYE